MALTDSTEQPRAKIVAPRQLTFAVEMVEAVEPRRPESAILKPKISLLTLG